MSQKLNIKCKTKNGQYTLSSLNSNSTIHDLLCELAVLTGIKASLMRLLQGYPPSEIDVTQESKLMCDVPIRSGDVLIVEETKIVVAAVIDKPELPPVPNSGFDIVDQLNSSVNTAGILMRQEVPSDNSCLFTSVHYVMSNGKFDTSASTELRQIISNTVARDPATYNDAFLGKSNAEYCQWILNDITWGGAIEVSILSKHHKVEIVVADTKSENLSRFGENENYDNRVLLIYDGIHYDPLYMADFYSETPLIQTIFPRSDDFILDRAKDLLKEAKLSHQYTDVRTFKVKCKVCDQIFAGADEANQHAINTRHSKFDECK